MAKIYFWLKLKQDFFNTKEIKKLRKIAGGDTYTIIYLKLQLLSVKNEGKLFFEGIEETFAEELALELDEEVDNVEFALLYLEKYKLLEKYKENECFLVDVAKNIGSETQGAERVRRYRENKKALQCNTTVTKGNTEIELEIEKEIELELDTTKVVCSNKLQPILEKWNSIGLQKIISIKPGTSRYTLLNARLKEFGLDKVLEAIDNINKSSFLRGQNAKGWTINFDWLIKPNNFIKVLERNYSDKELSNGTGARYNTAKDNEIEEKYKNYNFG